MTRGSGFFFPVAAPYVRAYGQAPGPEGIPCACLVAQARDWVVCEPGRHGGLPLQIITLRLRYSQGACKVPVESVIVGAIPCGCPSRIRARPRATTRVAPTAISFDPIF